MSAHNQVPGSTRNSRRGRRAASAIAVVAALVLAACSGDDASTDTAASSPDTTSSPDTSAAPETSANSSPDTSAAPTTTEPASGAVTDLVAYTGGTAGPADDSLEPVKIGWFNQEGGGLAWPAATEGAQAAVNYINSELGGIDGHPLELSTCFVVQSEQDGNACGLQFSNDDSVKTVLYGTAIFGDAALQAVLQGSKPILMANSISTTDAAGDNVYIYNGNPSSIFGGLTTYLVDELQAKTVSLIYPQDAQSIGGAETLTSALEAAGVTVNSVGFDPATTNLTAAATAAGVLDTDAIVPLVSFPPACVAAANAFKTLNVTAPVVSTGSFCFTKDVAQGLGGDTPEWLQLSTQVNVADSTQPDVQAYIEQSTQAGLSADVQNDSNAALAWGLVMTAARLLNAAGGADATEETIAAEAVAFSGPMLLGPEVVACGTYPTQAGLCGFQTRVFENTGGNVFLAVTDWLDPTGVE
ncbi:MAG: ABC transporter substrate-binding protein [Ilumatobacteraceae bacterium]